MGERKLLIAWFLVLCAAMACGRTKLLDACPLCDHDARDASGKADVSAAGDVAQAAHEASAPDEPAVNCGQLTMSTSRSPADVLIVLDRSQWMGWSSTDDAACLAGNACSSRWQVMRDDLGAILDIGAYVRWGLKLFPSPGAGACGVADSVEVSLALDSPATIKGTLESTVVSDLAPLGDALRAAGTYLQELTDHSARSILLASSGVATCAIRDARVDAAPPGWSASELDAVQAAGDVHSAGIPVYVLSFDGPANAANTAEQAFLGALASAGGTTNYYSANDKQGLLNSLLPAPDPIVSCVMSLPTAPPDPDHVSVTLTGGLVPRDPTGLEGWNYTSSVAIALFGSYCDKLRRPEDVTVTIVFGCP